MSPLDSHKPAPNPGSPEPDDRDNYRDIPVLASGLEARTAFAGFALDVVADEFLLHRRLFDEPSKRRSKISWPRQVAICLVLTFGVLPTHAAAAFGVDLTTVRAAQRAVKRRSAVDQAFCLRLEHLAEILKGKAAAL